MVRTPEVPKTWEFGNVDNQLIDSLPMLKTCFPPRWFDALIRPLNVFFVAEELTGLVGTQPFSSKLLVVEGLCGGVALRGFPRKGQTLPSLDGAGQSVMGFSTKNVFKCCICSKLFNVYSSSCSISNLFKHFSNLFGSQKLLPWQMFSFPSCAPGRHYTWGDERVLSNPGRYSLCWCPTITACDNHWHFGTYAAVMQVKAGMAGSHKATPAVSEIIWLQQFVWKTAKRLVWHDFLGFPQQQTLFRTLGLSI